MADADYEVGRGKPPKHTRFPHQKVSRRGKKKGTKDWATLAEEELDHVLELEEQGRRVSIDKRQLVIKALVNKAAKGELKAVELLVKLTGSRASEESDAYAGATPEIIANFLRRHQAGEEGDDHVPA